MPAAMLTIFGLRALTCGVSGVMLGGHRGCPKLENLGAPGPPRPPPPAAFRHHQRGSHSPRPAATARRPDGAGAYDKDPPTASRMEKRIWHAVPT
ncbi:hypothetical protein GCM10022214_42640 [Actinomadura miaoliensis]|uniref:Secreted protein n=1 Tax=Actinomadura miaoliensis TaxID=430685 RepID=A0ABP7W3H9_9ACTN